MSARVLVAGVGNIFFGDDGFGCEVTRVLTPERTADVKIEDFGIAGIHLGFELLAGYEYAVIVDLAPRGSVPGTLYVIEPDVTAPAPAPDAHALDLRNVFALVRRLGGQAPRVKLVGCEPLAVDEGIGLSAPVAAAVAPAAALVRSLIASSLAEPPREGTYV